MDMSIVLLSFIISLVLTMPALIVMRMRGKIGKQTERIITEAETARRVVTAYMKKSWFALSDDDRIANGRNLYNSNNWTAIYEYEVNGRKYKLGPLMSQHKPPETITLYYPLGQPRKAVYRGQMDTSATNVFFMVLPILVWAGVYWVLMFLGKC